MFKSSHKVSTCDVEKDTQCALLWLLCSSNLRDPNVRYPVKMEGYCGVTIRLQLLEDGWQCWLWTVLDFDCFDLLS